MIFAFLFLWGFYFLFMWGLSIVRLWLWTWHACRGKPIGGVADSLYSPTLHPLWLCPCIANSQSSLACQGVLLGAPHVLWVFWVHQLVGVGQAVLEPAAVHSSPPSSGKRRKMSSWQWCWAPAFTEHQRLCAATSHPLSSFPLLLNSRGGVRRREGKSKWQQAPELLESRDAPGRGQTPHWPASAAPWTCSELWELLGIQDHSEVLLCGACTMNSLHWMCAMAEGL